MLRFLAALLSIAALVANPALADITGPATVTDGDSIKIDGKRIRLTGSTLPRKSSHALTSTERNGPAAV